MKVNFLCPKHSEWVYSHPEEAVHFLARDEYQGSMLFVDGQIREAIAYLGCAFDIAAILYELDEGQNTVLKRKLECLSDLLCQAYAKLGLNEYAIAVKSRMDNLFFDMMYGEVTVLHA